jgi:hypothetical protein
MCVLDKHLDFSLFFNIRTWLSAEERGPELESFVCGLTFWIARKPGNDRRRTYETDLESAHHETAQQRVLMEQRCRGVLYAQMATPIFHSRYPTACRKYCQRSAGEEGLGEP